MKILKRSKFPTLFVKIDRKTALNFKFFEIFFIFRNSGTMENNLKQKKNFDFFEVQGWRNPLKRCEKCVSYTIFLRVRFYTICQDYSLHSKIIRTDDCL